VPCTNSPLLTRHTIFQHRISCHSSRSLPRTSNRFFMQQRGPSHRTRAGADCSSLHKQPSPPNNRLESAPCGRPTRKSEARLKLIVGLQKKDNDTAARTGCI
jgi:hypothetical protein